MSRYESLKSKRRGSWLVRASFVATFVTLVAACGDSESGPSSDSGADRPAEMTDVALASSRIAGVANVFLASEEGFFTERNLEVENTFIKFTPDIIASVVGGSTEFGHVNSATLLQALEANVPIQVVAPGYSAEPDESGLFVARDSGIESFDDLEGKRIGVAGLNNIQQIAIMATAGEAGADPTTFDFVEVAVPSMVTSLENGQVDAVALPEPFVTLSAGQVTEVVDDIYEAFGPSPILTYFITGKDYASRHPEVVRAFGGAIVEAQEFAQGNPDRMRQTVTDYTEISPQVAATMGLPSWSPDLQRATLQSEAEFLVKYGYLKEAPENLDDTFALAQGAQ